MAKKKDRKNIPANVKTNWYHLLGILIVTIIVYSNSINNDFLYHLDDDVYITNNNEIKSVSIENIETIFSESYAGLYLPLTMFTYMIEYQLFEHNSSGYHLINLVLHLINVTLVFILIRKIKPNSIIPVFVALFFAIHPMHVESVSWLSERKDLLYSLFYLFGIICYLNYTQNRKSKYYFYTLVLFVLALLSKPLAVSFALFPILIDWYYNRSFTKNVIFEKLPFFVLALVIGLINIYFGKTLNINDAITPEVSWINRIFLVSDAIVIYLTKLFAPINQAVYYYYPQNPNGTLPLKFYISSILLLIIIVLLGLWIKKSKNHWRDLVLGIAFFIIPTIFTLQLIPIGRAYAAERYTYLSYIGLFFIIAVYFENAIKSRSRLQLKFKPLFVGIFVAYTIVFSILTYSRNKVWSDSISMFTDMIEKYPNRGHPYFARGIVKYQLGDMEGALEDYNKSISNETLYAKVYANRAAVRSLFKDYSGALEDCNQALQLDSNHIGARSNRGLAYLNLNESQSAINDFTICISIDSLNPNYYKSRVLAYRQLNRQDLILLDLERLIDLEPNEIEHYTSHGDIAYQQGNFSQAVNDFKRAIKINYSNKNIHFWLGNAYFKMNDYEEAIEAFSNLISLDNQSLDAFYNRGVCYLKIGEIEKACSDWQQSLELGKSSATNMIRKYCRK